MMCARAVQILVNVVRRTIMAKRSTTVAAWQPEQHKGPLVRITANESAATKGFNFKQMWAEQTVWVDSETPFNGARMFPPR